MKDFELTKDNLGHWVELIKSEIVDNPVLLITTQCPNTGKWGMARLWRSWMTETANFMAGNGCKMPLMINPQGVHYGERPFSSEDAHELFTSQWLGLGEDGKRLSWSKSGRDDMRPATKSERYIAMMKHENWAIEKGITLMMPRDSEYLVIKNENGDI